MKKLLQKYLPDQKKLRQQKSLQFLERALGDGRLWHFSRRSVPGAFFAGLFAGFLPIPFQMVVAALIAIKLRCNLPLSLALAWFSNPLTYVPVFYFTYRVGAWMMGLDVSLPPSMNIDWLLHQLAPLWLGSVTCGLVFGGAAWLLVVVGWRWSVRLSWQLRRLRRKR